MGVGVVGVRLGIRVEGLPVGGCVGNAIAVEQLTLQHVVEHDVVAMCRTKKFVEQHIERTHPVIISGPPHGSVIDGDMVGSDVGAKVGDAVGDACVGSEVGESEGETDGVEVGMRVGS